MPTWPVKVRVVPGTDAVSFITRLVSVHFPIRQLSPIATGLAVGTGVAVLSGVGLGVGLGAIVWIVMALGLPRSAPPTGFGAAPPPQAVSAMSIGVAAIAATR